jgi:hypothetical protein
MLATLRRKEDAAGLQHREIPSKTALATSTLE